MAFGSICARLLIQSQMTPILNVRAGGVKLPKEHKLLSQNAA